MYAAITAALVLGAIPYNTKEALQLVRLMETHYARVGSMRISFEQTYVKRFHGPQGTEKGRILIKRPGKLLWEYTSPRKKLFVIDGKKLWIYEPDNRQVFWSEVRESALPASVRFLWSKVSLADEYDVKYIPRSKFGGPGLKVLKLKPKKRSPHYRYVLFVIDGQGRVHKSIVYSHQGDKNIVVFKNTSENVSVKDDLFRFTPPKGVQVIHAAAQSGDASDPK